MLTTSSLPDPDPAALERSQRLSLRINSAIRGAGGVIGFDRYMQMALYEPALGYYAADAPIFGGAGDFVTAPEAGELFAWCLARQCRDILVTTGGGIVEYGAGSGRLACALLGFLRAQGVAPEYYVIVEPSAALARRQRELLSAALPEFASRLCWCDEHPAQAVTGVVIANEVLDAMPVKRFMVERGRAHELGVRMEGEGFGWSRCKRALDIDGNGLIAEPALALLPDGYVSEYNPALAPWLAALRRTVSAGVILLADYGYPRHEYLHPRRSSGTLKCHYRHRVHSDPFLLPGLQDITAAVDFSELAERAEAAGFAVAGYASQASFLLACGLEECLAGDAGHDARLSFARAQEAKLLLLPGEMGQACKFMALTVGYAEPLRGFQYDERHRLSAFLI